MKKVVSFKVDEELNSWLETAWRDNGFASRSDFLRTIVINLVENGLDLDIKPSFDNFTKQEKIITFKLDNHLLERLDALVEKKGYFNRSDFLRDVLRYIIRNGIE